MRKSEPASDATSAMRHAARTMQTPARQHTRRAVRQRACSRAACAARARAVGRADGAGAQLAAPTIVAQLQHAAAGVQAGVAGVWAAQRVAHRREAAQVQRRGVAVHGRRQLGADLRVDVVRREARHQRVGVLGRLGRGLLRRGMRSARVSASRRRREPQSKKALGTHHHRILQQSAAQRLRVGRRRWVGGGQRRLRETAGAGPQRSEPAE